MEWKTSDFTHSVQELHIAHFCNLGKVVVEVAGSRARDLYTEQKLTRFREVVSEAPTFGLELELKSTQMRFRPGNENTPSVSASKSSRPQH